MDMCDSAAKGHCSSCAGSFCEHCMVSHECIRGPRLARFRILSVNDVYTVEGFAKAHDVVRQKRAGHKSMFCVAGDFLGGSALAVRTQGQALVAILNEMQVDSVCIGNHEFDYSSEGLTACMKKSKFRWFGSNVVNTSDGTIFHGVTDTQILTVPFEDGRPGGVTVGVFGVCTAATPSLSYPGPSVKFLDVVSTAQACVKKLRAQGANVIIALTHVSMLQDKEIAKNVEGISLLLGGHDHTPFLQTEGNTWIMKFGQNGDHVGMVDLEMTWDPHKPEVAVSQSISMLSTANVEPAPEIIRLANNYGLGDNEATANLEQLVKIKQPLSTITAEARQSGCSFGAIVADAFAKYHHADLGLINGGFMRGDKLYDAQTVITVGLIKEELPFPRDVVQLTIKGADLLMAMEEELSYLPQLSGSFPHVSSGWVLHYDPAKPVGSRIDALLHNGVPLDRDNTLRVALTGFMATGGDKCVSFTKGTITSQPNPLIASNVVIMYLRGLRDSQADRKTLYELDVPGPRMFAAKFSPFLAASPVSREVSAPSSSNPVSSAALAAPIDDQPTSQTLSPHPVSSRTSMHSPVLSHTSSPPDSSSPPPLVAVSSPPTPLASVPPPLALALSSSFSTPAVTSFYLPPGAPGGIATSSAPADAVDPFSLLDSPSPSPGKQAFDFPSDDNQFRHGLTNACTELAVMSGKLLARLGDISKRDLSILFMECKNPPQHGQMADILEADKGIRILTEGFPGTGFMSATNVEWSEQGLQKIFHELTSQHGTVSCPITFGGYTLSIHRVEYGGKVTFILVDTHNVDNCGSLILKSPTPEPIFDHLRRDLPKTQLGVHGGTMEYCIFRVVDVVVREDSAAEKLQKTQQNLSANTADAPQNLLSSFSSSSSDTLSQTISPSEQQTLASSSSSQGPPFPSSSDNIPQSLPPSDSFQGLSLLDASSQEQPLRACSACTFANNPARTVCELCQTPLPH